MKRVEKLARKMCPTLKYIEPQEAPIDELCTAFEAGYRAALNEAAAECRNKADDDAGISNEVPNPEYWIGSSDGATKLAEQIQALADVEEET